MIGSDMDWIGQGGILLYRPRIVLGLPPERGGDDGAHIYHERSLSARLLSIAGFGALMPERFRAKGGVSGQPRSQHR
jgi:hypothetical protein